MLKVGIIGYGYWGPNIVRNFSSANGSTVAMVCDMRTQSLDKVTKAYPQVRVTNDSDALIRDPDIDAVAIITPVFTHYELAKKSVGGGEKYFCGKTLHQHHCRS